MKQIDTGGQSFRELRKEDMYYVDKSLLIKDILDTNRKGVYLFTRPRRFGKTTNLSMLDAFFNMEYKGNDWFDGLEISEYPEYGEYKNRFPVIYLNLKDTKSSDFDIFTERMKSVIGDLFEKHSELLDWDGIGLREKRVFLEVLDGTVKNPNIRDCIPMLCRLLERKYGQKAVILIDEYDRAVSDAYGSESHRPMMDFLGDFMCAALKNNDSLQMACVTGITQIAGESIFSGLNNIKVNNIFSIQSDERFGFTETEVKQILSDFGRPEKFEEVKQWYDGYRFGNAEVYNPFSVMNYVSDNFTAKPYWVNSGGNWIIKNLLDRINDRNMERMMGIVSGSAVTVGLSDSLAYGDLNARDEVLYSLMAMAGYLKAVPVEDDTYEVSLPNEEVRREVEKLLRARLPVDVTSFGKFAKAVSDGDAETMEKILKNVLPCASYMNLRDENAYEMVVMTMLYSLINRYSVRTEREEGNGRIDILLTSKIPGNPNIIVELKVADAEGKLDPALDAAMCQMHERKYYLGMSGKVILTAMAFWGKIPKVRTETVEV